MRLRFTDGGFLGCRHACVLLPTCTTVTRQRSGAGNRAYSGEQSDPASSPALPLAALGRLGAAASRFALAHRAAATLALSITLLSPTSR